MAASWDAIVHVDEEGAHAILELAREGVVVVREQPPWDLGVRHGVVSSGEHDLIDPPVAQLLRTVAHAHDARRLRRRGGRAQDEERPAAQRRSQHDTHDRDDPPRPCVGAAGGSRDRPGHGREHEAEDLTQAQKDE